MPRPIHPSGSSASAGRDQDTGTRPSELSPVPASNWPGGVQVPGSPGFERSAKSWLLDLSPPRCRYDEILHRRPAELARLVRSRLESDIVAMNAGLRAVREGHAAVASRNAADGPCLTELYTRERDRACELLAQVKLVERYLTQGRGSFDPHAPSPSVNSRDDRLPPAHRAAG
jgi:hypothetical protein